MRDLQCNDGGLIRLRPWLTGGALALSAAIALGCGSSSDDDKASDQAAATTNKAAAAATTPATPTTSGTPATSGTTTTTPAQPVNPVAKKYTAEGTVRLMAKRLGTPGTLVVVSPKGLVDQNNERWYKIGTEVTLRASSTKTARFAGWTQGCTSKAPLCKVKITKGDYTRVFAAFKLDQEAAKQLKPSDPALKSGIYALGSGPGNGPGT